MMIYESDINIKKIRNNLVLMMIFDTLLASTVLIIFLYSVLGMTYEQLQKSFWGFLWIVPLTMLIYSALVYLYFRPVLQFIRRYKSREVTDRLTIISAQNRIQKGPPAVSLAGFLFWLVGSIMMALWMVSKADLDPQKGWLLVCGGIIAAFGTNSHSMYRLKKMIRPFSRLLSQQSQASKEIFKEATSSIRTRFLINLLSLIIFSLFFSYLTLFSETFQLMESKNKIFLENKVDEISALITRFHNTTMLGMMLPFIDDIKVGKNGYVFLIDRSDDQITTTHIDAETYSLIRDKIIDIKKTTYIEIATDNIAIAAGPVDNTPFIIGVLSYRDEFTPDMHKFAITSILVIAICIILSLAMASASSEDIVEPIQELIDEAAFISDGDLEHPIYTEGTDEIAVLANTFEKMRISLKRQMEEKSKKVRELTSLYELGQQLEKAKSRQVKLNALLTSIVYKLNYDRAVLFMYDEEKKLLSGTEIRGNNPNNLEPTSIAVSFDQDNEIIIQSLKSGSSILIENAEEDNRLENDVLNQFECTSFITLPLRIVLGPIGVIVIDNNTSRRSFTQDDLRILSIITKQVIASIQSGGLETNEK